jgi:hypothetical protein
MMAEAQWVMSIRMMGLAGVLPLTQAERQRMVAEKGPAFARAWSDAAAAAQAGHSAERVLLAAVKPIGRRTRANARRLTKGLVRRSAP